MYCLIIDTDLCNRCGACESALPGLHDAAVDGRLLISPHHLRKDGHRINTAVRSCQMAALTVEEVSHARV